MKASPVLQHTVVMVERVVCAQETSTRMDRQWYYQHEPSSKNLSLTSVAILHLIS